LIYVMRGLVPRIHVLLACKGVDGRDTGLPAARARRGPRPGHDDG